MKSKTVHVKEHKCSCGKIFPSRRGSYFKKHLSKCEKADKKQKKKLEKASKSSDKKKSAPKALKAKDKKQQFMEKKK